MICYCLFCAFVTCSSKNYLLTYYFDEKLDCVCVSLKCSHDFTTTSRCTFPTPGNSIEISLIQKIQRIVSNIPENHLFCSPVATKRSKILWELFKKHFWSHLWTASDLEQNLISSQRIRTTYILIGICHGRRHIPGTLAEICSAHECFIINIAIIAFQNT